MKLYTHKQRTATYEGGSWGDTPGDIREITVDGLDLYYLYKTAPRRGFPIRCNKDEIALDNSDVIFWVGHTQNPERAEDFSNEEVALIRERLHEKLHEENELHLQMYCYALQAGREARWGSFERKGDFMLTDFDYSAAEAELSEHGFPSWIDSYLDFYRMGIEERKEKGR